MDPQQEPGSNSDPCPSGAANVGARSGSCWWSPTRTRNLVALLPSRGRVWRVLVRVLVHIRGTLCMFVIFVPCPTVAANDGNCWGHCCCGYCQHMLPRLGMRMNYTKRIECVANMNKHPNKHPPNTTPAGQEHEYIPGSCW